MARMLKLNEKNIIPTKLLPTTVPTTVLYLLYRIVMNSTLAPSITPYTDVEPTEPISEDTQLLPNKEKVSIEAVVVKQLTSQRERILIKPGWRIINI
ncbi:unnamed protein product [Leptidea sinapis]|uniref:Uncharacterized protein n=1 Tax=Leptidea sinapis TaxID=189913 RepID=A0A5E4Q1N0_9NEOP|nr:unnamed protein product [Leptidea sinapis]